MKTRKTSIAILCVFAIFITYAAYCLRYHYTKLPIRYYSSVPDDARKVIESWYSEAEDIPYESFQIDAVCHALLHPNDPSMNRCIATRGDSNWILVVNTSGDGCYKAYFGIVNGRWDRWWGPSVYQ